MCWNAIGGGFDSFAHLSLVSPVSLTCNRESLERQLGEAAQAVSRLGGGVSSPMHGKCCESESTGAVLLQNVAGHLASL